MHIKNQRKGQCAYGFKHDNETYMYTTPNAIANAFNMFFLGNISKLQSSPKLPDNCHTCEALLVLTLFKIFRCIKPWC